MAIKTYTFRLADLFEVTFEVNHDLMSDEMFHEVNGFWSGGAERLKDFDGDVYKAVLRLYARNFLECTRYISPVEAFNQEEGFYNLGEKFGIKVLNYDRVDFYAFDLDFIEDINV